jgi:hypothetical protein
VNDISSRLTTALAERYRLERELGAGGMATVYLAQDLKHDRQVAIKVLRPELAAVIGAERFVSEIRTTANLQHPHILPLHDSGEADSFLFYVMPFIEGESLRDRLAREKQLPIPEAVRITKEIAAALDYAHRKGVVHRDIKPENILLHDGQALVADFGIALAASKAGGDRMTQTGMSLGTPSYMSPEQAMGEREIGPRSDVYALGAVAYEMLTGEAPFSGPTAQSIVAKVMTEEPASIHLRRKTVPPAVESAVLTALQKLPADRWSSARDFSEALDGKGTAPTQVMRAAPRMQLGGGRTLLLPGLLIAVTALAAWGWLRRPADAPVQLPARYEVRLPYYLTQRLAYSGGSLAISPDGGTIAYVGREDQGSGDGVDRSRPQAPSGASGADQGFYAPRDRALWVRDRDAIEARALPGTTGADAPFFSPDGRWIGYFVAGRMYKMPVEGGPPVMIGDSAQRNVPGAVWRADGTIWFIGNAFEVRATSSDGGASEHVLALPANVVGWTFPAALPRADAMLVTACSNNCAYMSLVAVELPSGKTHELVKSAARGWYTPSGHLVYVRQDGSVFAQPFDLRTLTLHGSAQTVLPRVRLALGVTPELAVSASGTMVHFDPGAVQQLRVVRASRDGRYTPVDPEWQGNFNYLSLSPDGRRLAISVNEGGRSEIWIKQLDRGPLTRLAFEGTVNYRPAWHPDGRTIGFISDRTGPSRPYVTRADGSSQTTPLEVADTLWIDEIEWSRDHKWLLYRTGAVAEQRRVAMTALPSTSGTQVEPGKFDNYMPTLSPDGRWLAYVSVESGREEVYVRPFPNTGDARWQVSRAGGTSPAWSHSGLELFFIDGADRMLSAPLVSGASFQTSEPQTLFTLDRVVLPPFHQGFAVSPDDRSFVLLQDPSSLDANNRFATLTLNALQGLAAGARP